MDSFLIVAIGTLITIVNPIGAIAPFLSVAHDLNPAQKTSLAKKATIIACFALFGCAAVGQFLFQFYGITLPAVKISGGILVLLVSIDMLHAKPSRTKHTAEEEIEAGNREVAGIFPLSIPLLAGPGSILSTFLLMEQAVSLEKKTAVFGAIALVMFIAYLVLVQAERISKLLGQTGVNIMSRLMGLVLASVATQFIIDGLGEAFPALVGK